MRKACLALALLWCLLLCACTQSAQAQPTVAADSSQPESADIALEAAGFTERGDYPYEEELLAVVNRTLAEYANGSLPEPMRYNTDYNGITGAPPPEIELPQELRIRDIEYGAVAGEAGWASVMVSLPLDEDYFMTMHINADSTSGTEKPSRVMNVNFYDMRGAKQVRYVGALRGGDFYNMESDRLYAFADFEDVRTDAGRVSGSLSWDKANRFVWIDIDNMREPFFYTYFVAADGGLIQDYPQKDWQRYDMINDDKMMSIAQSLFDQFYAALLQVDIEVDDFDEPSSSSQQGSVP